LIKICPICAASIKDYLGISFWPSRADWLRRPNQAAEEKKKKNNNKLEKLLTQEDAIHVFCTRVIRYFFGFYGGFVNP
jgi:hypothetical protein